MKRILCSLIFSAAGFAASFVSDGSQVTSAGPAMVIQKHPGWANPLPGSEWISFAQTGNPAAPGYQIVPNGFVMSVYDSFEISSAQSSSVTFMADDSAALYVNGGLVVAEASMNGNHYSTCSDVAPGCLERTAMTVYLTPFLVTGTNHIRFDVAQRAGWSFGLNYRIDVKDASVPEPASAGIVSVALVLMLAFGIVKVLDRVDWGWGEEEEEDNNANH